MTETPDTAVAAGKGSLNVSAGNIVTLGLGAIFFSIYSRILTTTELGIVATVLLVVTVFQYLGQFGLYRAAPSLVAGAMVDGTESARRVVWCILLLTATFAAFFMVVAFFLAEPLSELLLHTSKQTTVFRVAAIMVFANALAFSFDGVTQGMRNFVRLAYADVAGQVGRILISLILLFRGYSIMAIIVGGLLGPSGFVSMLVELQLLIKQLPFAWPKISDVRHVIKFAIPLHGVSLLLMLSTQLDLAIMVATNKISQVGVYSVVLTISQVTTFGLILPLNASMIPYMTKINREKGKLDGAFAAASRFVSIISIPATFVLISVAPIIIFLIAGTRYLTATIPLVITLLGLVPYAFFSVFNACLQAKGKNTQIFAAMAAGVIVEGISGLLLAPVFGPRGAATSRMLLLVTMMIVAAIMLHRTMRYRIERGIIARMTVASSAFLLIPILGAYFKGYIGEAASILIALAAFIFLLKTVKALRRRDVTVLLNSLPAGIISFVEIIGRRRVERWIVGEEGPEVINHHIPTLNEPKQEAFPASPLTVSPFIPYTSLFGRNYNYSNSIYWFTGLAGLMIGFSALIQATLIDLAFPGILLSIDGLGLIILAGTQILVGLLRRTRWFRRVVWERIVAVTSIAWGVAGILLGTSTLELLTKHTIAVDVSIYFSTLWNLLGGIGFGSVILLYAYWTSQHPGAFCIQCGMPLMQEYQFCPRCSRIKKL